MFCLDLNNLREVNAIIFCQLSYFDTEGYLNECFTFLTNILKDPRRLCMKFFLVYSRNSYTMGCPPVRGDNPRALASGLSYVQVDKHGINIYTTYISVDVAHHDISYAKVGKGGINVDIGVEEKSTWCLLSPNKNKSVFE